MGAQRFILTAANLTASTKVQYRTGVPDALISPCSRHVVYGVQHFETRNMEMERLIMANAQGQPAGFVAEKDTNSGSGQVQPVGATRFPGTGL
jgi:hypothetical protein